MVFAEFLKQIKDKDFFKTKRVLCLKGSSYPFLFCNKIIDYLKNQKLIDVQYQSLIINQVERKEIYGGLQQSFLGQNSFYWLGELKVTAKDKKDLELLKFLTEYKGPNFVAFFLNDEKLPVRAKTFLKNIDIIELEDKIDKKEFDNILKICEQDLNLKKQSLVDKFFRESKTLTPDACCMLLQHLELTNTKFVDDSYDYLASILLDVQPSLYALSGYFFTRQTRAFFKVWEQIHQDYSEMFWVAFWSEQIWKAFYVVKFLKNNNFTAARSVSYRLPFTFIQKDWKNFSPSELQKLHQMIYNIDFAYKNGSTFCLFDLFYFKHFTRKNI